MLPHPERHRYHRRMADSPDLAKSPLAYVVLGNPIDRWLAALACVLAVVVAATLLRALGRRVLQRFSAGNRTRAGDLAQESLSATRPWLLGLVAMHPAAGLLELPPRVAHWVFVAAVIAGFLQIGLWAARLAQAWIDHSRGKHQADSAALTSFGAVSFLVRFTLWVVVALLALDNLGVNVSALVAGLGIGGIAIGLALQNILGDLFASLSIVLDRPFSVGDAIRVDDFSGTVENIGVKTTRVRSDNGELLVFANGDLTKSRLRNFGQMRERRVVFGFTLRHSTTPDGAAAIPPVVRAIIAALPDTRFERAHLKAISTTGLEFEVVYWMLTPDYRRCMDTQQALNLELLRHFASAGIEVAAPQTITFQSVSAGATPGA